MNKTEYDIARKGIEDILMSLYLVDIGSLALDQRKQHRQALDLAYRAVISFENNQFSTLTDQQKQKLDAIANSISALQQQLAGLKKAHKTLSIVASGLNIISSIIRIF